MKSTSFSLFNSSIIVILVILITGSCNNIHKETNLDEEVSNLHFSLGQWCYNELLFDSTMNNFDFVDKAAELEFDGVEYVNQFFMDRLEDHQFLDSLSKHTLGLGLTNSLLLVDLAGNLASSDEDERNNSLEKHKKWVDATVDLACPAMRINVHGDGDADSMMNQSLQSLKNLLDYAESKSIKILIENHGGISNDADWLKALVDTLHHDNLALVVDFNNWCVEYEKGQLWGKNCIKEYSRYEGMQKLIPYADNISVKAFGFDEKGEESKTDYGRMATIIKNSDYSGVYGIEFEGHDSNIDTGVVKTRELIKKHLELSDE